MTILEKTGCYLSIIVIIALLILIVFSEKGFVDYTNLQKKNKSLQNQIMKADTENQKLENEIISLKTDMEYIKHIAKHDHDMAQKDELIFKDKSVNKGNR